MGIAAVWIVGVYIVIQRTSSPLSTWPSTKHTPQQEDKAVEQLLTQLDQLEHSQANTAETYTDLTKKFLYFIDRKYRIAKSKEPSEIIPEDNKSQLDVKANVLPQPNDIGGIRIPVIVFACNRVSVSKCLDNLLRYRPNAHQFPIIVSQVRKGEKTKEGGYCD